MGRLDAIYGSADHLWLLLGRLTDFSYRDRKRKLKAAKTAGTDWRPNPGFFKFMARFASSSSNMRGAPPRAPAGPSNDSHGPQGPSGVKPNAPQSSGNTSNPSGGNTPMYGMVPPRGPVQLPPAFADTAQRNWSVTSLRTVSRLTGWKSSDAIARGCERSWFVAAKQGRGPPYEPSETRQSSADPSLQQRSDGQFQPDYNNERRFVTVSRSTGSHWAMGILSLEDDILNLEINDRV